MDKQHLRRALRKHLPDEERQREGEQLLATLRRWPLYQSAAVIAGYWPLLWEMDTRPLNLGLLEDGKTLALPLIHGSGMMTFHACPDPAQLLPGPHGLKEPPASAPLIPPEAIQLMLLPCEGADRFGVRLGKGGGYYDRYLARILCPSLALLLPHQFSPLPLPREAHDLPADYLYLKGAIIPRERIDPHG